MSESPTGSEKERGGHTSFPIKGGPRSTFIIIARIPLAGTQSHDHS